MLVECTVNTNTVKLLKKISMLLSQPNRHIQILTLYVDQRPDPSILKQKLDDLSEEFDMTYAKDSIFIEWTNKKVIVSMQN